MRTEYLTIDEASVWDTLVERSEQASPFVTRLWLRLYCEIHHSRPRFICLFKDEHLVAGVPILEKKRGPIRYSPPMAIGNYNGPLIDTVLTPGNSDPDGTGNILKIIQGEVEKIVSFYSSTLHPSLTTILQSGRKGWTTSILRTYISDIKNIDSCWQVLSQSFRRKIRRAGDEQYSVHETGNVKNLVRLHHASYRRKRVKPPLTDQLLVDWLSTLHENGLIRIFELRSAIGHPLASRAIAGNGHKMYDFLAGMESDGKHVGATHFLVWDIMRRLSAEGCTEFDFMGANTPGPSEFKRGFGGILTPYTGWIYHRSRILRAIEQGQRILKLRMRGL